MPLVNIYQHAYGDHYKRKQVEDPSLYLDTGWFLSVADHKASLKPEPTPKKKAKTVIKVSPEE